MDQKIHEARLRLREIYSKYVQELYEVVLKIDNSLEVLEQSGNN